MKQANLSQEDCVLRHIKDNFFCYLVVFPIMWPVLWIVSDFHLNTWPLVLGGYLVQLVLCVLAWLFRKRAVTWLYFDLLFPLFIYFIFVLTVYYFWMDKIIYILGFCLAQVFVFVVWYKALVPLWPKLTSEKVRLGFIDESKGLYTIGVRGSLDLKDIKNPILRNIMSIVAIVGVLFSGYAGYVGVITNRFASNPMQIFLVASIFVCLLIIFVFVERVLAISWMLRWEKENNKRMNTMFLS